MHVINRARPVANDLRPMVRQTWWVQATGDFVLRAKLGHCVDRQIDIELRNCEEFTLISKETVPAYFSFK